MRLEIFKKELYKEEFLSDEYSSGSTIAMIWALFDVPLILYAIGINGAAIIELHSILERFAIRELSYYLSEPSKKLILYKILERSTLPYLAQILHEDLGILDSDDLKHAKQLNALRNGIAHKNPKPISNLFLSGKDISFLNIDYEMSKIDCLPQLIDSIRFMINLFRGRDRPKNAKNPS
jgi:hypothetical protein